MHCREWLQVPISLVYNKHVVEPQGSAPLLLDAYGAYGVINAPRFSRERLSLLDRGIVYAIAHVRGGGEMGRRWYETGKFLDKPNTFKDVVAAAEHLVSEQWTQANRLVLEGRSAGGMTVGAVANMRPDLFHVRSLWFCLCCLPCIGPCPCELSTLFQCAPCTVFCHAASLSPCSAADLCHRCQYAGPQKAASCLRSSCLPYQLLSRGGGVVEERAACCAAHEQAPGAIAVVCPYGRRGAGNCCGGAVRRLPDNDAGRLHPPDDD